MEWNGTGAWRVYGWARLLISVAVDEMNEEEEERRGTEWKWFTCCLGI